MATHPPTSRPQPTLREEMTSLPNLLTLGRIVLIPGVMVLMLQDEPVTSTLAAALCAVAAATDWLDGWLARRRGQESIMGKLFDPLADKLLVMAILIIAAELQRVPGWFVVIVLAREVAVTGLRSLAGQQGLMIDVVQTGKWKTALQLLGLIGVTIHFSYRVDFLVLERVVDFNALGLGLLAVSMLFSLSSAGIYFVRFLRAASAQRGEAS